MFSGGTRRQRRYLPSLGRSPGPLPVASTPPGGRGRFGFAPPSLPFLEFVALLLLATFQAPPLSGRSGAGQIVDCLSVDAPPPSGGFIPDARRVSGGRTFIFLFPKASDGEAAGRLLPRVWNSRAHVGVRSFFPRAPTRPNSREFQTSVLRPGAARLPLDLLTFTSSAHALLHFSCQ